MAAAIIICAPSSNFGVNWTAKQLGGVRDEAEEKSDGSVSGSMRSMGACGGKGVCSSAFDDTMSGGGVIETLCMTCCDGTIASEGGVRETLCGPSCEWRWNC